MFGADVAFVMTVGSVMEQIGWAVINNLHILFAAAIGGNWLKIVPEVHSQPLSHLS